ncbi:MAG TPA: hypothetical protein VGL41_11290 [Roseiarcus sp.]|jgi:hypothetical protein
MRARVAQILVLSLIAGPAHASAGWTFCVAEAGGGKDVWITGVFPAVRDRERLEADLKAYLRGRGVAGAVAQCPAPTDDKVEMVNAQFTAAEFHHKLGDTLHEVFTPEFDPRR